MLGRVQRALHRGVLAGLQQQQHQQHCQQLEVLGLQAARSFFNDYKASKSSKPRKLKQLVRRSEAVHKIASRKQQAEAAAGVVASSSTSPAAGTSAAAAAAAAEADATSSAAEAAAAAAPSSGPVSSPLSQVPQTPGSSAAAAAAPTAVAATEAAAPATTNTKSSWVPTWLDNLMDYPRRRRSAQRPSGTTSPLQSNTPDAAATAAADPTGSSKKDDGWGQVEQMRNMTLEAYQTSIANEPAAGEDPDKPPLPSKPANRGPSTTLRSRMDRQRVAHARYEQQGRLISMMDDADKTRISADPLAFMKDHASIRRIALLADMSEGAVRDMLYSYQRKREFAELLLSHRDAGKAMPSAADSEPVMELYMKLKRQKARRDQVALLQEFRDPQNCQLKAWAGVVGKNRKCPRTELPYRDCCGRLTKKALQQ